MSKKNDIHRKAREIHARCILVDGHNDLIIRRFARGHSPDMVRIDRRYHSDAARLLRGGTTASFFMVGGGEKDHTFALLQRAREQIAQHPDRLLLATKASHIRHAKRTKRLAVILSWESCSVLANRLEPLRLAWELGLRVSTLTHGEGGGPHDLQGSPLPFKYVSADERRSLQREAKGLTDFGEEVLRTMNRLGILVDVAHANDRTVAEVLELSSKPVVSTHGGVYRLCPHTRCSTDDQIRALAAKGGLISIAFYRGFLAEPPRQATVDDIVRQIAYVADLVGIDHVAIGSDFDGLGEEEQPVIPDPGRLPILTEMMLRYGFNEGEIRKVWGENYLRVFATTVG
ncbi:MAG: dipeptidase [Kiritimatiellia bacterium]